MKGTLDPIPAAVAAVRKALKHTGTDNYAVSPDERLLPLAAAIGECPTLACMVLQQSYLAQLPEDLLRVSQWLVDKEKHVRENMQTKRPRSDVVTLRNDLVLCWARDDGDSRIRWEEHTRRLKRERPDLYPRDDAGQLLPVCVAKERIRQSCQGKRRNGSYAKP